MRYVPAEHLRNYMVLGENLYGYNHELMLTKGMILTERYLNSIKRLRFNGVYIEDDISEGIVVTDIIDESVRAYTIKAIKDVFIQTRNEMEINQSSMDQTRVQIEAIVDEILKNRELMINMVDLKMFDDYTYSHSMNVAILSIVLGSAFGLKKHELNDLGLAAWLHDIGKVFLDKDILNKTGQLTEEEFKLVKTHCLMGSEYIKEKSDINDAVYMGILDHHEKFGGDGYPNNHSGEQISLYGRIISLADIYDALTSDRPYRKAMLPSEVMEYIMGSTSTLFDPALVHLFVRKIAPFPIGTCVRLSNGSVGIVSENRETYCLRPRIRIFQEESIQVEPYELDLAKHDSLSITVVEIM